MKKNNIVAAVIAVVLIGAVVLFPRIRALWPALGPGGPLPTASVSQSPGASPVSQGPLHAAPGWTVSLLTDKVPGARDLERDQFGNVWVSQTSQGIVSIVYLKDAKPGIQPEVTAVLKGLRKPHGLAFDPKHQTDLYVAQETSIGRLPTYSDGGLVKVADLPVGGSHFTRSLVFGHDGRLYVTIGSTCNVCREKNGEHASVISMKPDGSDRKTVASGLRNAVFVMLNPQNNHGLWVTEMGRDNLGDKLPPDEVDAIDTDKPSQDYGWPICYSNRVHDTQFDTNVYIRDPCADTVPPMIALGAHVAPLGLAVVNGDLLVAEHGSWNSSVPVGYKVVRLKSSGGSWSSSDFLTGFLKGSAAIGRPVDVLPMPDGSVLVSDDKAGAIWKVTPDRR